MRLHPAESRITRLSGEIPASYVVFDVLVWEGEDLHDLPLEERRARGSRSCRSPSLRRPATARWPSAGRTSSTRPASTAWSRSGSARPYLPGSREAVVKVKKHRSADCVVIGVTWSEKATGFASLMLGLYNDDGKLLPVGTAAATGPKRDEIAALVQPLLGPNPERRPRGAPSRWQKEQLEWSPIEPKLVVEVRYDKWQGQRFRHGTTLPPLPPGQGSGPVHGRPGRPQAGQATT